MLKKTKKFALNFKSLRFLLIPVILFSTPLFNKIQDAKAGLEFQWDDDTGYRKLKWYQRQSEKRFKNTTYFFLRPKDRKTDLLKINLSLPKKFKVTLNEEKIRQFRPQRTNVPKLGDEMGMAAMRTFYDR